MEHDEVFQRITSILDGENDWVTAMATVVCELHNAFDHYHWTGFYRTTEPGILKIGPYQGGHGCLVIPFDKGICGAAARTGETQDVPNVHDRAEHIACSSSTNSEVVDFKFEDVNLEQGERIQLRLETDQVRDWHKPTAEWFTTAPTIG